VDGVATICDLGSRHGIRKAGRLVQTAELHEDESVEMGRISVRARVLHDEPVQAIGREDDACAPRIALDFVNHRRRGGGAWSVEKSVTIIGASQPSRVRLEHPSVSRVHCMLVRGNSAWWLVDLGSRIGTMLDGVRVSFAPVAVGAELRVGGFRIRVTAPTDSEIAGETSNLIEEQPRSGSALLTELTRSSLASRESRSRRTTSGVTEELVVELFREFASLHERTLTQLQQTFREMLDIAVSPRNVPALPPVQAPAEARSPMPVQPKHFSEPPRHAPEPVDVDSPNLAVVNLSVRAEDPEDREAAHDLLAAQLRSIEDNLEGERKSLARRLLKTLSLGR
jgi:pSer/pThr/pTyr-binding forkhead associated (FHA) protein